MTTDSADGTDDASFAIVLRCLSTDRRMDTHEVEEATKAEQIACADSTARLLRRMRDRGLVEGELDLKRKTWVWWRKAAP